MKTLLKWASFPILLSTALGQTNEKPPMTIRNLSFGTCAHFDQGLDPDLTMPHIAALGVGWIRDDIHWSEIEPEAGKYRITPKIERWLASAQKYNLHVLVIFNGGNKAYPNQYDPEAYAKAATWLVRELKGRIHAIEILNEPFNFGFGKYHGGTWNALEKDGSVSPWAAKYVELLNKAAAAVRRENPEVKIIGLGSSAPVNFRQLAMGIAPEVDGVADHPYSARMIPEIIPYASSEGIFKRDGIATADENGSFVSQVRMYREESARHKGPKELWLTEWGYSTYREGKVKNPMFWGFTEEAQAKYAQRRMMECLGLGVEVSFQYDFRNDNRDEFEPEHNFGLMTVDLEPKPAYFAVQNVARETLGFKRIKVTGVKVTALDKREDSRVLMWDGSPLKTPDEIRCYAFMDAEGRTVLALWSTERAGDLQARAADLEVQMAKPAAVRVTDLLSNKVRDVPVRWTAGVLKMEKLAVPDHPILVRFER